MPAGRWVDGAGYAVVARIDSWHGGALLVGLREEVPFDTVEATGAKAAAAMLEMSLLEDRALTKTLHGKPPSHASERHHEREATQTFARVAQAAAADDVATALDQTLALGHHAVSLRDASGRVIGVRAAEGDDECRNAALDASATARAIGTETRVGFARHGAAYREDEVQLAQQTADTLALLGRGLARASAAGLRVLAVEDHPVMRLGVRAMLEREGFVVAGTSATCTEAIGLLPETAPDVVLLDLHLPDATAGEAVIRVREAAASIPIVVFSVDRTPALIRAALRAGANGYVTKDAPIGQLAAALRAAASGLVVMGADEAIAAAGAAAHPLADDRAPAGEHANAGDRSDGGERPASEGHRDPLTPRELELLRYMAEGYTNKEVARAMVLAEDTVKKAVQTLIAKLGATDRTHAVVLALRAHFIE